MHPIYNGELKALNDYLKIRRRIVSEYDNIFLSEQGTPFNRATICRSTARRPGLMPSRFTLTCFATPAAMTLANRGADTRLIQGYLGHQNILHTVRYTELSPNRFDNLY